MHLFICFFVWATVISLMVWRICQIAKQGINYVHNLHKIPCSKCVYFTGNYHLKCTVHPIKALSEEAIDCRDFEFCSHRRDRSKSHYCKT